MSGRGAFVAGGRWNTPGQAVVYCSGNLTLSMLELLVHIDDAQAFRGVPNVYHTVEFPLESVAFLAESDLPVGWNQRPEHRASQLVGSEWLESRISPVLAVPSVIIPPGERYRVEYLNYLINPAHPDTPGLIRVGPVLDLEMDGRLASSTNP